ncbi:MAG: YfhO family protein, partial [Lachnospiraceae bacterium]|nr:YfhO family protein [Lachnospiraceae bacterium]
MERKRDSILIATGAALLTFFVLLLLFGYKERLPGQESTFIYGDGFSIYSNFISGFWRQLLSGERIDYSFSTTMGMPSIAIFSSAICPFNIIYLCFSDPDTAACLATFLKIMTASAAFSMLLKKTQSVSNDIGIVFGAAYGLCGYVLNFYYIYIFLDQVYMLPIIVLLLRRLMKTGHWKLLSVAYAYLFIVQIYGGYVTGIITGVLYLVLGWYYFGKNLEQWKKITFLFARCVLIAVLISMIYVLPEMGEMFRYTEGDAESFTGTGMKAADLIGALYIGVQGEIYNHWPIIYSTIVALIAVVCWFLEPEIQKEKKIVAIIIFLFLIITTVVSPLYLLMHAGNNPDGVAFRFSYFYSFVFLYIASDYVSARKEGIKKREILVVGIVAVLYIILYILNSFLSLTKTISESGLIWNILFLLGYMLFFLRKNRKTNRLLLLLMTSELVCNGGLMLQNEAINNTINRKYYQAWQQQL